MKIEVPRGSPSQLCHVVEGYKVSDPGLKRRL